MVWPAVVSSTQIEWTPRDMDPHKPHIETRSSVLRDREAGAHLSLDRLGLAVPLAVVDPGGTEPPNRRGRGCG